MKKSLLLFALGSSLLAQENGYIDSGHQKTVEVLNESVKYLPEITQNSAKGIVKDIKDDGLNLKFFGSISAIRNERMSSEANSAEYHHNMLGSDLTVANIGVSLLPNTWNINLSYSGVIDDQFDKPPTSYRPIYNENSKKDFKFFDIYLKPIDKEWGNVGIGFQNTIFGSYISVTNLFGDNNFWSQFHYLDIESPWQSNSPLNKGELTSHGYYSDYYTNIESKSYYITYGLPKFNVRYVPNGLGVKYEYRTSNKGFIKDQYDFVVNPNSTMNGIGFGIYKTDSEITNGFNIKKLFYTVDKTVNKYYNYLTSQNEIVSRSHIKKEIELVYSFKTLDNRGFYILGGKSLETEKETKAEFEITKFSIGYSF